MYLRGIGAPDGDCGTGWNTGPMAHNLSTCTQYTRSSACGCSCCYSSCRDLGLCSHDNNGSNCGWATCYDDVNFTLAALDLIGRAVCIDMDRVYATGVSNGAMFVHWLISESTRRNYGEPVFAAAVPIYGLPLLGGLDVPHGLSQVPIMIIYDRFDTTIPQNGGPSDSGWLYEPLVVVLREWAVVHGCDRGTMVPLLTPYDGGKKNISCAEHPCNRTRRLSTTGSTSRVVKCLYDGHHGSWFHSAEALTWWFLSSHGHT